MISKNRAKPKNNLINYFIYFLAAMAVILGFLVYKQSYSTKKNIDLKTDNNTSIVIQNESTSSGTQISPPPRKFPADMTKEEQDVLNVPVSGSAEMKSAHYELAVKLAKSADYLNISGCIAKPVVFKIKLGQNFEIRNNDNTKHIIAINKDYQYEIPANGKKEVMADFKTGKGLYGFGCDQFGTSGLILVTE